MAEKKRKEPDPLGDLANHKQESIEIDMTVTELAKPQKFNLYRCQLKNKSALSPHQICKGKSAMELSNNTPIEHMDIVDRIKENHFNQIITITQSNNLSRCRLLKKKSALFPEQICKGKSAMEPSINITKDMDTVDQAIGIFQEEIIMEILSRLPVQSLHRFKCVSKFWMALISDPYFKKKHLNRAKNDKNFQKLLASKVCPGKGDIYFYCSSLSSVPQSGEDEQKLDFPLNTRASCRMLCSCDGLVLVSVFERNDHEHLILWNPSTRESKLLPLPGHKLCYFLYGLGYDSSSNDYKILAMKLNNFGMDLQPIQSKILALKSGSWRYCKYPTHVGQFSGNVGCGMDYLAFIHGAFHWLGYKDVYRTPIIVTFDISSEVFGEIPLPGNFEGGSRRDCGVSVLGGTLCSYVATFGLENGTSNLWVWEMKEYGVMESWTCLLSIQDTDKSRVARPQHMYADGEVLIHCKDRISADFIYRRTKGPSELLPSKLIVMRAIPYTESLISPNLLA